MKRLAALTIVVLALLAVLAATSPSSAHAGGGTVDGLSRQSTSACSVGNPNCAWINFQGRWTWAVKYATGQGVFGAHVLTGTSINNGYLTGSDRGSCFFVSAPTNGFVVDGTVHYWSGEPEGQGKYIPPCISVPYQQPPAVAVVLPPAMKMQQFGTNDAVAAIKGIIFADSGAVYMNCWTQGVIKGWVLNGEINKQVPSGTNPCWASVGRWK